MVFGPAKVALFVDGCFWHGCPDHGTIPKNNRAWWAAKLEANSVRDRRVDEALDAAGWKVIRVWEHEDPAATAMVVAKVVEDRRRASAGR